MVGGVRRVRATVQIGMGVEGCGDGLDSRLLTGFGDRDRNHSVGAGWRTLQCRQPSVDVAVQLVVQVEVSLVLERRSTGGALEAISVEVLVLDAHEHAYNETITRGANVLTSWKTIGVRWWFVDRSADVLCDDTGGLLMVLLLLLLLLMLLLKLLLMLLLLLLVVEVMLNMLLMLLLMVLLLLVVLMVVGWFRFVALLVQQLVHLGVGGRVDALILLEVDTQNTSSEDLSLGGQGFSDGLVAVHGNWRVVLLVDDALDGAFASVDLFLGLLRGERFGSLVVSAANVLHRLWSGGQRGLGHWCDVSGHGWRW